MRDSNFFKLIGLIELKNNVECSFVILKKNKKNLLND